MPARSTALPAIEDQNSLLAFLSDSLDWPVPIDATLEELTFDWTENDLRLSSSAAAKLNQGTIRQFQSFIAGQPFGIFLVEFNDPKVYRTALRQILRALVPSRRRDPNQRSWKHDNLLFICVTRDYQRITFAHFRGNSAAKAKLSTFGWTAGSAYLRTLLEFNLPQLYWPKDNGADPVAWVAQWAKAFDKEPLTKEFFKRFDAVIDVVKRDLEKIQKLPAAQAYSRAQLLIERLLFLYFLQNRGWLDQKRSYLLTHFEEHRADKQAFTYYENFVEKLFFTLATPFNYNGPGSGARLDGIPFLNGGLFDDDEFAQTTARKRDNPPLRIRNQTFAFIFDHLLEAFNFTVREDTPLNQDVAVDPEMLGKVFESIILHAEAADPDANAPDKRKATGSYYTPRIVVHFICREALRLLLLNHVPPASDWGKRLRTLLDVDASDGLDPDELAALKSLLSPKEAASLLAVVEGFRCLDPAVGSGAFPVGLLHELVNLRRVLRTVADGYVDPIRKQGQQWIHDTKSHIVENCLYGVDIQQQAIEICRLRLWLSLIVDYDLGVDPLQAERAQFIAAIKSISQLPNLEMNFRRGDSLLDTISGIPVRVEGGVVTRYRDEVEAIQKRGHELHKARKSEKKKELRLEILRQRLSLAERVLHDQITDIDKQEAATANWFGETKSESEKRRQLAAARENLDQALAKIETDRKERARLAKSPLAADFYPRLRKLEGADFDSPFNFVWNIDYAGIFTPKPIATLAGDMAFVNEAQKRAQVKGGFDLIIGNPPFVTARNAQKRELYRERWPRVCYKNYLLVCPFFDMSFGLLRSGGQLGFIVSNAFAKRDFGKPLIEDFFPTVDLQKVIDCSGLMFPGHGTPTCLVFGQQRGPNENSPIRVVAILPGGGDLRTTPEESLLWQRIAAKHEDVGFSDERVSVTDRPRKDMRHWPWNFVAGTSASTNLSSAKRLEDLCADPIGRQMITGRDDVYVLAEHCLRRLKIPAEFMRAYGTGEDVRNWAVTSSNYVIFPYTDKLLPLPEPLPPALARHLTRFRSSLESCIISGTTQKRDTRLKWFEYARLGRAKLKVPLNVINPHVATHCHFVVHDHGVLFKEKALAIAFRKELGSDELQIIAAWLNSAILLNTLKRECFSKRESEDAAKDTYFEFAGEKLRGLVVPGWLEAAVNGKSKSLHNVLGALAGQCGDRGRELASLGLRKLFETPNEAYHAWNASLPGSVKAHKELGAPFSSTAELEARFARARDIREKLRREMIARQEEIDWLVYTADGLIDETHPAAAHLTAESDLTLDRDERPFRLWSQAGGDFDKALVLIPIGWSAAKKRLWRARLETIRDNEHIRRIEQPFYKRRWDEQWKVSNRWECGPAAYAQEFVDAFEWWLSEKAEWNLEHKAKGGPLMLADWSAALFKDARIAAAWPVIVESLNAVESWRASAKDKKPGQPIVADHSTFAKFFRDTIDAETIPNGIPPAIPWDDLEKKGIKANAQLKKVRGKLNVPRERFRRKKDGTYVWAGAA